MLKYIDKSKKNKIVKYTFFIFLTVFVLLNSVSFGNKMFGVDSWVYQYVSKEIMNGARPYTDKFDHKGPLIYLINIIGLSISNNYGIWLMEFLSIFTTYIFSYKALKLFCDRKKAYIAFLVSIPFLYKFVECGNSVEFYAPPFIALSMYIFLQYFKYGYLSTRKIVIAGICFGMILMLKANMFAVWLSGCLVALFVMVKEKDWMSLKRYIGWFFLGTLVGITPFIMYMAYTGCLADFFDVYILFNLQYSTDNGIVDSNWTYSFLTYGFSYPSIICMVSGIYYVYYNRSKEGLFIALSLFISYYCIFSTDAAGPHYMMPLLPLLLFSAGYMLNRIDSKTITKIILAITVVLPTVIYSCMTLINAYVVENISAEKSNNMKEMINAVSDPDDKITVFGNTDGLYIYCDRMSASKYSYQYPLGNIRPEIYDEYFKELQEEKPSLILYEWKDEWSQDAKERMMAFINENGYQLYGENEYIKIYGKQ